MFVVGFLLFVFSALFFFIERNSDTIVYSLDDRRLFGLADKIDTFFRAVWLYPAALMAIVGMIIMVASF